MDRFSEAGARRHQSALCGPQRRWLHTRSGTGHHPNGYAEPDFMGWEIKQYGVRDFVSFRTKSPVTLMTPEPTGGVYRTEGVAAFMKRFGYPDQAGRPDRFTFGDRQSTRLNSSHSGPSRMQSSARKTKKHHINSF